MPGSSDSTAHRRVQYAALPYRQRQDGEVQVRLITSRETRRWVIPKGWPMKGLAPHKAAAREAFEEAGLLGSTSRNAIGMYTYEKRLSPQRSLTCDVMVFPMRVKRYLKKWPERSQRIGFWFTIESAAAAVQEDDLRELILRFGATMAARFAETEAARAAQGAEALETNLVGERARAESTTKANPADKAKPSAKLKAAAKPKSEAKAKDEAKAKAEGKRKPDTVSEPDGSDPLEARAKEPAKLKAQRKAKVKSPSEGDLSLQVVVLPEAAPQSKANSPTKAKASKAKSPTKAKASSEVQPAAKVKGAAKAKDGAAKAASVVEAGGAEGHGGEPAGSLKKKDKRLPHGATLH